MPDQVIRVTNGSSLIVRSGAILGVGPSGPIGPQGAQGPIGPNGSNIYFTATPPTQSSYPPTQGPPRSGDSWVNPSTGLISVYDASAGNWVVGTTSIKGPQGIQGPQGSQGPIGQTGPQGAAGSGNPTFNSLLQAADRHAGYPF